MARRMICAAVCFGNPALKVDKQKSYFTVKSTPNNKLKSKCQVEGNAIRIK